MPPTKDARDTTSCVTIIKHEQSRARFSHTDQAIARHDFVAVALELPLG